MSEINFEMSSCTRRKGELAVFQHTWEIDFFWHMGYLHGAGSFFFTWKMDHEQRQCVRVSVVARQGGGGSSTCKWEETRGGWGKMKLGIFAWACWVANIIYTTFLQLLLLFAVRAGKCAIDFPSPTGSFLLSAEQPANVDSKPIQQISQPAYLHFL